MQTPTDKFLEFNGKVIYFLAKDGQYWIALRPICEALNVDYNRQFQNLKNDEILNQLFAKQQMVGADNKLRKMVSLPERYIYGWLFSIRSESPELLQYKRECYNLLFEHFHGKITSRETLIGKKTQSKLEHDKLMAAIRAMPEGQKAFELEKIIRLCNAGLKELDNEIVQNQLPLFV
jgi:hypothetical protein